MSQNKEQENDAIPSIGVAAEGAAAPSSVNQVTRATVEPGGNGAKQRRVRLPTAFSSFRHRNYQLWFGGQLISVIGTWMDIIAEGWLVYQLSHSEFALGLLSFASAIPVLFVSPWGGVVVDRMPKRTLIVITQATTMLMSFTLATLAFTHVVKVWHMVTIAAILGIVNSFDAPARQALVVELVGREDLPNAIALNSMMFNGARVVGPAIGGLLLALFGAAWCFLINGISFIAVIIGLLAMTFPPMKIPAERAHPLQAFLEGVRYSRHHRVIFSLLALSMIFSLFGTAYSSLMPAFIDQVLHAGAAAYGTINACVGAGALTGALWIAQYGSNGKRGKVLRTANLVYPAILALFAFNSLFPLAMVLAFGLGLGFMLLFNNVNSLLQLHVEDQMRGRVMSLYTLAFFGFSPFGTLLAGAVAERIPLSITIGLTAAITLLVSLAVYWKAPEIGELQ